MKKYFSCKKFFFSASTLAASLMCLSSNAHASYLHNNHIATSHVQLAPSTAPKRLAIGYYTNYGDTVPGIPTAGRLNDSLSNAVSHGYNVIDLAFLNRDKQNKDKFDDIAINPIIKCDDSGQKDLPSCILAMKAKYPNVKFIASIGGQDTPHATMNFIFDRKHTSANVHKLISYIKSNHLDGVDFDLEPLEDDHSKPNRYSTFTDTHRANYLRFITQLHATAPELILTFAASGPDLWHQSLPSKHYLDLDIWSNLLQSGNWDGWFQVQYYNQDSSKPSDSSCGQNQPFDGYFYGKCSWGGANIFTKYAEISDPELDSTHKTQPAEYKNFDWHFVIGTPASPFSANDFMDMDYLTTHNTANGSGQENMCANLLKTAKLHPSPSQIITDYFENSVENGHPNIRGFMNWDIYNDYDAHNYNCSQFGADKYAPRNMISWQAYDWINTLNKLFIKPGPPKPAGKIYTETVPVKIHGLTDEVQAPAIAITDLTHTITEPACKSTYSSAQCKVLFKAGDEIKFNFTATGKYSPAKGMSNIILNAKGSSLEPNSVAVTYEQHNPPKPPPAPSKGDCKAVVTWESDGATGYYAQADITEVDATDGSVIWKPDYAHHINTAPWTLTFTTDAKVSTQGFTGTDTQLVAEHASYFRDIALSTTNSNPIQHPKFNCALNKRYQVTVSETPNKSHPISDTSKIKTTLGQQSMTGISATLDFATNAMLPWTATYTADDKSICSAKGNITPANPAASLEVNSFTCASPSQTYHVAVTVQPDKTHTPASAGNIITQIGAQSMTGDKKTLDFATKDSVAWTSSYTAGDHFMCNASGSVAPANPAASLKISKFTCSSHADNVGFEITTHITKQPSSVALQHQAYTATEATPVYTLTDNADSSYTIKPTYSADIKAKIEAQYAKDRFKLTETDPGQKCKITNQAALNNLKPAQPYTSVTVQLTCSGDKPGPGPGPISDLHLPKAVQTYQDNRWRGVNLAGADFNNEIFSGTAPYNDDKYHFVPYPQDGSLFYLQGANTVRIPILYEYLLGPNWKPGQGFDKIDTSSKYWRNIQYLLKNLAQIKHLNIILDMHDYMRFEYSYVMDNSSGSSPFIIGDNTQKTPSTADYAAIWGQLDKQVSALDPNHQVTFELMNEPYSNPGSDEASFDKLVKNNYLAAIKNIYATNGDTTRKIMLDGGQWSGMHAWSDKSEAITASAPIDSLITAIQADPQLKSFDLANNLIVDVHQYFNQKSANVPEFSGHYTADGCHDYTSQISNWVSNMDTWSAQHHGIKWIVGEIGIPDYVASTGLNATCQKDISTLYTAATATKSFKGFTLWKAGHAWGPATYMNIQPGAVKNTVSAQPSSELLGSYIPSDEMYAPGFYFKTLGFSKLADTSWLPAFQLSSDYVENNSSYDLYATYPNQANGELTHDFTNPYTTIVPPQGRISINNDTISQPDQANGGTIIQFSVSPTNNPNDEQKNIKVYGMGYDAGDEYAYIWSPNGAASKYPVGWGPKGSISSGSLQARCSGQKIFCADAPGGTVATISNNPDYKKYNS